MGSIKDADFRTEEAAIKRALWNFGFSVGNKTRTGEYLPKIDNVYKKVEGMSPEIAIITRSGDIGRIEEYSHLEDPLTLVNDTALSPNPANAKKVTKKSRYKSHKLHTGVNKEKVRNMIKIYNLGPHKELFEVEKWKLKPEELSGLKCDWGENIEIGIEECGSDGYNAWQITENWDKRYAHRLLNPSRGKYTGTIFIYPRRAYSIMSRSECFLRMEVPYAKIFYLSYAKENRGKLKAR
jgi:hypothetical protein